MEGQYLDFRRTDEGGAVESNWLSMAVLKAYQAPNLLEYGALIIEKPANDDGINVANNLITNLGSRSAIPDVGPSVD